MTLAQETQHSPGSALPVLVTNARSRVAYNVIRSLARRGLRVFSSDSIRGAMSFFSRYSRGHFVTPSYADQGEAFLQSLREGLERLEILVLLPVHEETYLIAKHRHELPPSVKTVLPDYGKILAVHNKDTMEELARELGIPVPETFSPEQLRQTPALLGDLPYPVLIKPRQGGGGWAIREVSSREELERLLGEPACEGLPWERFFIQRKITGETHCVALLFRKGEPRARVTYRQIREYPVSCGQATLRESLRNEEAEGYLQRLLEKLEWHGVCQADFIVDDATGVPYLIDVNPRFWGSVVQASASGVDFPYLAYRIAVDGDVEASMDFETGVVTRWLGGDLCAFWPSLRAANRRPAFVRKFLFPGRGSNGRRAQLDDLSFRDPLPFWAWLGDSVWRAARRKLGMKMPQEYLKGTWE